MIPLALTDKTRSLGAPTDWTDLNGPCETLDIYDFETPDGNFMISAWLPSKEELDTLNAGGSVFLKIRGVNHPVVSLTTA